MSKVIAIANHKGGVGKTTSVASIGLGLSLKGYKVLLLDLDAQANLTSFFLLREDEEDRESVYGSLVKGTPLPVREVGKNLYLVPSSLEMARVEGDLSSRIAREQILNTLLDPVREEYDYILLDCPPALGVVTTNAFIASNEIYIPLTAEALPLKGMLMIEDFLKALQVIRKDLHITGMFITRYNNRNLNEMVEGELRKRYKGLVFDTKVRENISLAEVPLCGGNIFEYAPNSNGAIDYRSLTDEVVARNK